MHELQYHLTVHNPYRPLEGLLIDIKVINSLPLTSQCLGATIYQTILVKNVRESLCLYLSLCTMNGFTSIVYLFKQLAQPHLAVSSKALVSVLSRHTVANFVG